MRVSIFMYFKDYDTTRICYGDNSDFGMLRCVVCNQEGRQSVGTTFNTT